MKIKAILITIILVYVFISLPGILGFGYVIDWLPGTPWFVKIKEYVTEGLTNNFIIKAGVAVVVGAAVTLVIFIREQTEEDLGE